MSEKYQAAASFCIIFCDMPPLPLVSVCIPTYNSQSFILDTIESVLQQSYQNLEVIICDDCSHDQTVEIIRSIQDARIKLFQNETNLGIEGNWNKTLLKASGHYAKVMGADDILASDCIQKQVAVFEDPTHDDVVLVSSHKNVIDERGKIVITRKFPGKGKIAGLTAIKMCLHRGTNIIGEPVAGLFRMKLLQQSGYYNGENMYMIDIDLWSRMLKFGSLFVVDQTLYSFRISRSSISSSLGFSQFGYYNRFVRKLSADKAFKITVFDILIATIMSFFMVAARNLFYLRFISW